MNPTGNPYDFTKEEAAKGGKVKQKGRLGQGWATRGIEGEIARLGGICVYFQQLNDKNPGKFADMVQKHIVEKKDTSFKGEITMRWGSEDDDK